MFSSITKGLLCGSAILTLTVSPLFAETVESAFDIAAGGGSVNIGKKGQGKHKFTVGHTRAAQRVDVTVSESGTANGEGSKFTYDVSQNLVQVSSGGKTVNITIRGNKATIGTTVCASDDTQCISKAVYDALPQLTPEEVAAAFASASADLMALKFGDKVQDVLEALALTLASQQATL